MAHSTPWYGYKSGLVNGMRPPICSACHGTGTLRIRVQRRRATGGRICTTEGLRCPPCQGTGHATEDEVDRWLQEGSETRNP